MVPYQKPSCFMHPLNHRTRTFTWLLHSHKIRLLVFFVSFYIQKWQISLPFHIPLLVKSLSFDMSEAWKRYLFQAEPSRINQYTGVSPGVDSQLLSWEENFLLSVTPVACFIVGGRRGGGGGGINNPIWFSSQSRSPFSALFKTFCLTVRAYLNTQKYEYPWITMTETRFYEPSRLSTQPKPLFH